MKWGRVSQSNDMIQAGWTDGWVGEEDGERYRVSIGANDGQPLVCVGSSDSGFKIPFYARLDQRGPVGCWYGRKERVERLLELAEGLPDEAVALMRALKCAIDNGTVHDETEMTVRMAEL